MLNKPIYNVLGMGYDYKQTNKPLTIIQYLSNVLGGVEGVAVGAPQRRWSRLSTAWGQMGWPRSLNRESDFGGTIVVSCVD